MSDTPTSSPAASAEDVITVLREMYPVHFEVVIREAVLRKVLSDAPAPAPMGAPAATPPLDIEVSLET